MGDMLTDVLVAGYQSIETAQKDFDGLIELVKAKKVKIDGAILVSHDTEGNVTVADTGNHLGRKGAGWGGGVGVLVGLFAPPLLAVGRRGRRRRCDRRQVRDHKLKSGIHDKIGENLPLGSAGVIAMFDDDQRLAVEQALPGLAGQVDRAVRQGRHEAAPRPRSPRRWASSRRTARCCRCRIQAFGGTSGRTLDDVGGGLDRSS